MNRITELRESHNLSIRACALAAGLTPSTLFRAEKGERKLSTSQASTLASFFGVSVDYLLGKSPEEMYVGFVESFHNDFVEVRFDSNGEPYEFLSEEVKEPIRSKLNILFRIKDVNDIEHLSEIYEEVSNLTALEDFPPFEPKKDDDSKNPKVAELKNKLIALIKKIDDIKSLEVLLSLAKERGTESEDGAK